jgi:hypothetical protein
MPKQRAYELMKDTLADVLPSMEACARAAKSAPAKKKLLAQIQQVKQVLKLAEEASSNSIANGKQPSN